MRAFGDGGGGERALVNREGGDARAGKAGQEGGSEEGQQGVWVGRGVGVGQKEWTGSLGSWVAWLAGWIVGFPACVKKMERGMERE